MSGKTSKTAAPKDGAAVVVPADSRPVASSTAATPAVVVASNPPSLEDVLRAIIALPRCCCRGMHDSYNHLCAVTLAKRALGES